MKYIICSCMLVLFSCHKEKKPLTPSAILADYPLEVGNKWVYKVQDLLQNTTDTATFSIVRKDAINPDSVIYYTQTIENGIIVDSSFLIVTDSSVVSVAKISNPQAILYNSLFNNLKLHFPIYSNSNWKGENQMDSLFVLYTNQTQVILSNKYENLIEIKREQNIFQESIISWINFVPKVGVVSQSININLAYPYKQVDINLIRYELH